VSIAGIVTNLVVAFLFSLPFQILHATGTDISFNSFSGNPGLLFCYMMATVNVLLAAFNILPIPPLDGSKAIGILVPRRFERTYQEYLRVAPVILIGIFVASIAFHVNVLGPIIDPIRALFGFLTFLPTSLH
jgi:Zn-dependent protease